MQPVPDDSARPQFDAAETGPDGERFRTDPAVCRVPVADLRGADSPRVNGEDAAHIRLLASVEARLPPILVHRGTMRVIDGMHRLAAARLRGEAVIEVLFFDGSEADAFVLAVRLNISHGRPLALEDRTAAAQRIIESHPEWADRAIAAATGLSSRLVAQVRRQSEAERAGRPTTARIGRDGRIRPTDFAQGRLRAAEIINTDPDASLRSVAKDAGVSLSTAQDVRSRLRRGEDPVPAPRKPARRNVPRQPTPAPETAPRADLDAMMQGLASDPSLRFSETGRKLLRWMRTRVAYPTEFDRVSDKVPIHSAYIMTRIARQCADEWRQIADDLQRGTSDS
ncbi:ParB N-terminal domain-containing protein [Dactylosporangium vinaceum]|uniref:ParB/RepB/Spo0J family partition protein n=1 Tax=Dactylosporangium vinaceum TaxID=53362 RepID=A0ABV5MT39_9ACTN|nr:ParB/RepB/Spo0J family partition protein [Dactylosporangium vinaceum]UAB99907.1 ParB N-terminal domain-containing protein [Dactylosporangium vinaceum]